MGTKFNDYLAEQLKDPEFRKEFEALQAERAAKQAEHIPNREMQLGKFSGKYHIPKDIDECNDEVLELMEGRQ